MKEKAFKVVWELDNSVGFKVTCMTLEIISQFFIFKDRLLVYWYVSKWPRGKWHCQTWRGTHFTVPKGAGDSLASRERGDPGPGSRRLSAHNALVCGLRAAGPARRAVPESCHLCVGDGGPAGHGALCVCLSGSHVPPLENESVLVDHLY